MVYLVRWTSTTLHSPRRPTAEVVCLLAIPVHPRDGSRLTREAEIVAEQSVLLSRVADLASMVFRHGAEMAGVVCCVGGEAESTVFRDKKVASFYGLSAEKREAEQSSC